MLALPPDVVQWFSRSGGDPDCAVTAIALATGATYDAVLSHAVLVEPASITHGMRWRDIRAVVRRLGFSSRMRRTYDIHDDSGILSCKRGPAEHAVYLWEGRIVEPMADRRSLWLDPEEYLRNEGWTPGCLLTLKKD